MDQTMIKAKASDVWVFISGLEHVLNRYLIQIFLVLLFAGSLPFGCAVAPLQTADDVEATLPLGSVQKGSFQLGSSIVPLPAGEWIVSGVNFPRDQGLQHANVLLIQRQGNDLEGLVFVTTNLEPLVGDLFWNPRKDCAREDWFYYDVPSNGRYNRDCMLLEHWPMGSHWNSNWYRESIEETRAYFQRENIRVPITMIHTFYSLANARFTLSASYVVNPDLEGIPQTAKIPYRENDWHVDRIGQFPEKVAFMERVRDQGLIFRKRIREGFDSL